MLWNKVGELTVLENDALKALMLQEKQEEKFMEYQKQVTEFVGVKRRIRGPHRKAYGSTFHSSGPLQITARGSSHELDIL